MADNLHVNKVIYGGSTLIDLTNDDVEASDVKSGKIFHLPSGETATGTCTYDADTSDATAVASEILNGKTAYKNGAKITGTMPNRGAVTGTISDKNTPYTIQNGYHDGSGTVGIADAEKAKIISENIREGVTILGVEGSMSGSEGMKPYALSATAYTTSKSYQPTDFGDYNCFSSVTVQAIAYTETDNASGGKTVTIGTVETVA